MNTLPPDNLEQRLRHDAARITVNVDDNFSMRVSNLLTQPPATINRSTTRLPFWTWALAAPAVLALAFILGRETLWQSPSIHAANQQSLMANLEIDLDKALANRENDLHSELQKVRSDLKRVEGMLGFGGKALAK